MNIVFENANKIDNNLFSLNNYSLNMVTNLTKKKYLTYKMIMSIYSLSIFNTQGGD